jgi:RND superfamily putative drug exporter
MALLLSRLGAFSHRHRTAVVLVWLVLLVGGGAGAATLAGETSDSFAIPGQESTTALERISEEFGAAGGATAQVVVVAPDGQTLATPESGAAVGALVAELGELPGVTSASNPLDPAAPSVNQALTTGYSTVTFRAPVGEVTPEQQDALTAAVEDAGDGALTVEVTGQAIQAPPHIGGAAEVLGVVIALVVLAVTYGSLVVAGMNLLTAVVGVGIGVLGITIATGFTDLSSTTPILAAMLGLAVGIDYALFIVSRFRQELRRAPTSAPRSPRPSARGLRGGHRRAHRRHRPDRPVRRRHPVPHADGPRRGRDHRRRRPGRPHPGPGRAGLPRPPRAAEAAAQRRADAPRGRPRLPGGWVATVTRHRLVARAAGRSWPSAPSPSRSLDADHAGADPAGGQQPGPRRAAARRRLRRGVQRPAHRAVRGRRGGAGRDAAAGGVTGLDDVAIVTPPVPSADGTAALLSVIPESGPTDPATEQLVADLRDLLADVDGAQASVTGATAVSVDVATSLDAALPVYLALVVGLALVLLVLVFRSLLVPLVGVLGFVLTVGAALGATVAVFQWGWLADLVNLDSTGPLISLTPILVIGILFGLAMDYQIFLVSRMHEAHSHGAAPLEADPHRLPAGGPGRRSRPR